MKNEIETAIKLLSEKIDKVVKSEDALRFTQAALNLAHVLGILRAQRPWVGLTEEERASFWTADQMTQKEWDELFNAIEAKLREKNA